MFEACGNEAKRSMLSSLVADWLQDVRAPSTVHHATGLCLPHAALIELLHEASAARQHIIEEHCTDALLAALLARGSTHVAASAMGNFITSYAPAMVSVRARLSNLLAGGPRPPELHDGIAALASDNPNVRASLVPDLLSELQTRLLGARGFESFASAQLDIHRLKVLCAHTPYKAACDAAFS